MIGKTRLGLWGATPYAQGTGGPLTPYRRDEQGFSDQRLCRLKWREHGGRKAA